MASRVTTRTSAGKEWQATERGEWFRAVVDGEEVVWSGEGGVTESGHTIICDDDPDAAASAVPATPWAGGLAVAEGALLSYEGAVYRVIQPHTTQADWHPDAVPALYRRIGAVGDPPGQPQPWVQPTGAHDAYQKGDRVVFEGNIYESLIDANVWSPSAYPAGWQLIGPA